MRKILLGLLLTLAAADAFAGQSLLVVRRKFTVDDVTTAYSAIGTLTSVTGYITYSLPSSAGTLILGVGASGAETDNLYLTPTGAPGSAIPVTIPVRLGRSTISIKAADSTIAAGDLQITFLGN